MEKGLLPWLRLGLHTSVVLLDSLGAKRLSNIEGAFLMLSSFYAASSGIFKRILEMLGPELVEPNC